MINIDLLDLTKTRYILQDLVCTERNEALYQSGEVEVLIYR